HICEGDIHWTELCTRLPFKYGIATMTRTPHAFVRLRVEIDGKRYQGVAADSLPPKWFTKEPNRLLADEVDEMLAVVKHALASSINRRGYNPFDVWRQLYRMQVDWGSANSLPHLLSNFGTAFIERALIEAFCRASGKSFADILRSDALGMDL